jgi:hypothetical protein
MVLARYHGEPVPPVTGAGGIALDAPEASDFGFMFPDLLDDPANLLPSGDTVDPGTGQSVSARTTAALRALGAAMADENSPDPRPDGLIPAAYTYFGQFIDHDITKSEFLLVVPGISDPIEADAITPLMPHQIGNAIVNGKTPELDLDSLYKNLAETDATAVDGSMELGTVSPTTFGPIPVADLLHDLKRRPMLANPTTDEELMLDRQALIGDPRNDENLIVAQLHVAFLRAHNSLLKLTPGAPQDAVRALRRRYQWAILHDFIPRICGEDIHQKLDTDGPQYFAPTAGDVSMPLEFAGAAYRFGHSMIRQEYDHNATFNPNGVPATFNFMFTFTALSGSLDPSAGPGGAPTLPQNWIIDWARFFNQNPADPASPSANPARRIDTHLAFELGQLPDTLGTPQVNKIMGRLAARNLLRGFLLGLPTGQAVACKIGATPLSPAQLQALVPGEAGDLCAAAGLFERTPLWFYVLAEAEINQDGKHLGQVGGTIVGETLWQLVAHSPDSVLSDMPTQAELDTGEFTLRGIVKLGLDANLPPL